MNKSSSFIISIVALILSIVALTMNILCCNKAKNNNVEEALMAKPSIVIDAIKQYEQNMRAEAEAKAMELVKAHIEELNNDASTPFVGPEDAKVTVVEFFDYSCGYCHRLYPELKTVIEANPDVKFVFKPLTFLGEVSNVAARAALVAAKQGKFIQLHNALLASTDRLTKEKIRSMAEEQGLDMAKYDAELDSEEISNILNTTRTLANNIQVNGVPVLFINGKTLQTLSGSDIQKAIDENK